MASATPHTTPGRVNTAAWKPQTSSVCVSLSMKRVPQADVRGPESGESGLEGCD